MRGRSSSLLPLEESLLKAADNLRRRGEHEFYGYLIAREMQDVENRLLLPTTGTVYKVLSRLEKMGIVDSHWEAGETAHGEGRPARRMYQLSALGENVVNSIARGSAVTVTDEGGVVV